jgi:aminopeptidase N
MTLEALREKVGGATFYRIIRDWVTEHRYGNATTGEFVDLAERDSGVDLGDFLHAWLHRPIQRGKPPLP